ncbi:MAG: hypothetical protein IAI50_02725 [Candidatus Eremiobacteraeota bacterium]|nr:hypothetical protein [Candidatus Eremiobacteraeota bacterium]
MNRRAVGALAALALALTAPPYAARADVDAPALPRCPEADAALVTKLDSATNSAGDAFTFKIVSRIAAQGKLPEIPANTRGYGVVAFADHAHGSGQPGRLVVEPRYLRLSDGTHVPVMADPQLAEGFVQGETRNLNGALAFVPGLGWAVGGYNAIHRGREVSIERGTPFRVVLGDDLATAECFVPPPSAPDIR